MDILLVIVMIVSLTFGWRRRLVRQLISFAGSIGAGLVASMYFELLSGLLGVVIKNPNLARIISFVLIFLGVTWLVNLLIWWLRRIAEFLPLYWLDGAGGLLFGGLKGIVIIGLFTSLFERFPLGTIAQSIGGSNLAFYFQHFARIILSFATYTYFPHLDKILY